MAYAHASTYDDYNGSLYASDGPREEMCEGCGHFFPAPHGITFGKHNYCYDCIPTCDWVEDGEICGAVADPDGEGFCSRHEAMANIESEIA